ncbi:Os10g0200800 [Oryza sativa Japonica Group]|uniref:Os10g0200800 protein n=1 Tax=Oryza sativa subsp. japonica TaxID=39947 RepID=A0A0P0XT63_ORYSJ|nr:hypothetical protein EE612_050513 [Oryza sativa]BAT10233.1 Os10g0200800 [Oryza sativa Japonica Group]
MGDEATQVSASRAVAVHALCFTGIMAAHHLSGRGALVSNPAHPLRLLVVLGSNNLLVTSHVLVHSGTKCECHLDCHFWSSNYCGSTDAVDYMISAPAHGAVIGAWLGAWPMPLDWERPWQEWPISVTYGSVAGHLIGMAISLALIVAHKRRGRAKAD